MREMFCNNLATEEMDWRFGLSCAPWFEGQFKRMIGQVQQVLYKCTDKANLRLEELEQVLVNIKATLNNQP